VHVPLFLVRGQGRQHFVYLKPSACDVNGGFQWKLPQIFKGQIHTLFHRTLLT